MEAQGVLEQEDKIRLAEDNLRRLISTMGEFSVDTALSPSSTTIVWIWR